jgi:hypothetical protein
VSGYELGQRVRFTTHLVRGWGGEATQHGSNKVWAPQPIVGSATPPREGIIVGKRTLSNGWFAYGGYEDPGIYTAKEHFQAWMVVTDLRSAPVHVLPEHITALDQ